MNEASSKFVDKIATEKLLSEKLNQVHHQPDPAWQKFDTTLSVLPSFDGVLPDVREQKKADHVVIQFSSAVRTGYRENDLATCLYFPGHNATGEVIFVHGLYEDNRDIYKFFISQLNNKGLDVYALTLPFHYERKPAASRFSGEFYFSGDAYRNTVAFKQAVTDVAQFYHFVKKKNGRHVWLTGFSMGGGVGLTVCGLLDIDGLFAINPVCNIADLIWTSALFAPVKKNLSAAGFDQQDIAELYGEFEPLNFRSPKTVAQRVVLGTGLYDQINDPKNYRLLQETWHLGNTIQYKAGHLNILRVPKLAHDVARFYFNGTQDELL
ncbi:alpha/beta fold hydrolase [candidate division KSB1 bacterium]|nr:alpha/beta fold hydrolase [candidate division KSB1 bacterium]RQW00282.1 MAG: alpha/beta fold hydrolase [candidate division KSB1 bacterium]